MTESVGTSRGNGSDEGPPDSPPNGTITVTGKDLDRTFRIKHGDLSQTGWSPRMQRAFDYYNPDDYYEALVATLVQPETRWLDVGCGRTLFPSNPRLARVLSDRCRLLVGLDPSGTVDENSYVHRKVKQTIEDFHTDAPFDLVTLRMVAEHIHDPHKTLASLAQATRSGSRVVVYTVYKWSPVPMVTRLVPHCFHHRLKSLIWKVEDRDTHPVAYRLNTKRNLDAFFAGAGFRRRYLAYLDDCRTFGGFPNLRYLELSCRRLCGSLGLRYPECCILAVYERR